ncbi:MAG: hypothetical protein WC222_07780 [Parachlamydiales bacterium]|jgi:hypothetical protein
MAVDFKNPVFYVPGRDLHGTVEHTFQNYPWFFKIIHWVLPTYARRVDKSIAIKLAEILTGESSFIERQKWLQHAKTFQKCVLSKYFFTLRKIRKDLNFAVMALTLETLGLPMHIALANKDFVDFIRKNHLHNKLRSHKDLIRIIDNEPALLYYGVYRTWSQIKTLLSLNSEGQNNLSLDERGFTYLGSSSLCPGGIVQYNTKTWIYVDFQHESNQHTGISVGRFPLPWGSYSAEEMGKMSREGIQFPYIENYTDCRGEAFPDKAIENNDHAFIKMVSANGDIYWFGCLPKEYSSIISTTSNALAAYTAVIESPEHYADVPPVYRTSQMVNLSSQPEERAQDFAAAFDKVVTLHTMGIIYNAFKSNCVEFVRDINSTAKNIIPQMTIKAYALLPKFYQYIYRYFPLPSTAKRYIIRKLFTVFGINKTQKVTANNQVISLPSEMPSLNEDLTIPHPHPLSEWMRQHGGKDLWRRTT